MKLKPACLLLLAAVALMAGGPAAAGQPQPVTIGGMVGQTLQLDMADLGLLAQAKLKLNEADAQGGSMGSFFCQGPPLQNILKLAGWRKPAGEFPKKVDLALLVTARDGKQVLVSYGEIVFRNPGDAVLAASVTPVMPKKPNDADPEHLKQLARKVRLPKLALASDFSRVRCLEGVRDIQVITLPPKPFKGLHHPPYCKEIKITKADGSVKTLKGLEGMKRVETTLKCIGEGRGWEGLRRFSGVALKDILLAAEVDPSPTKGILVSSGDGYRSVISSSELFGSEAGARIILADTLEGKPIDHGGRFLMAVPGDLWADRWVKSVAEIQVVDYKRPGKFYVIGMGCGDPSLLTAEAVSALGMCDAFVAPGDIQKRFSRYLGDKPVLFDPMTSGRGEAAQKAVGQIKDELAKGRSVAFLDWGDPAVYGAWRWLMRHMGPGEVEFVAGMGAFGAGAAAVGRNITCNAMVELTDGRSVLEDEDLVRAAAAKGGTIAVFMAERQLDKVAPLLARHYKPETPAAVVCKAGFHPGQRVIRTTVGQLDQVGQQHPDQWLSLIFVGPCLAWDDAQAAKYNPQK